MSKQLYAAVLLLLLYFPAVANVVSTDKAQTIAINFYKMTTNATLPAGAILRYTQAESDGSPDFYVFDITPSPGFVIVSATDNVTPILAYSTESQFHTDFPEIGIKDWMIRTGGDIRSAIAQHTSPNARVTALWASYEQGYHTAAARSTGVSPMISTAWSQTPYYNVLCPYDNTNNGRSVTGCVATAMAQIMRYWSYPAQGVGTYSYVDSQGADGYSWNIGRVSADFAATTYDWSKMPSHLGTPDTQVARLLYHCGVAVGMNYSAQTSNAYFTHPTKRSALSAFKGNFAYDTSTIRYVVKAAYSPELWQELIETELNAGRPVFYTGQDAGNQGGHAWVCDGYDASGNLHMNWGWGGLDNGYFNIGNLNPGSYNFARAEGAIIGIQPAVAAQPLSLADMSEGLQLTLYPNPARDKIIVSTSRSYENAVYHIYDALGNNVAEGHFPASSQTLDISSLHAGVYFFNIVGGVQSETRRFVVE